jgi:hypothetical protein
LLVPGFQSDECHDRNGGTGEAKMTPFVIDAENSITALGSQQADFEGEIFASHQELADLAATWPRVYSIA